MGPVNGIPLVGVPRVSSQGSSSRANEANSRSVQEEREILNLRATDTGQGELHRLLGCCSWPESRSELHGEDPAPDVTTGFYPSASYPRLPVGADYEWLVAVLRQSRLEVGERGLRGQRRTLLCRDYDTSMC